MSIKTWFLRKLRTATGNQAVLDHLTALLGDADGKSPAVPLIRGLTLLEGTRYSEFLLPLEYRPSRDFRPRWGHSRPSHAGLVSLLERNRANYCDVIEGTRALGPQLAAIRPQFSLDTVPEPGWGGGPVAALDLAVLYYFVCRYKPATYLEIGSGQSTCFARRAIDDCRLPTRILSIDPEPRAGIDGICEKVLRHGLETVDLDVFAGLQAGDVVFMDGSHRAFMNSDVTVFMLDVLPLLRPGVIVHVHDICLPDDYPAFFQHWYWNEQYLLAIYLLAAADRIEVLMPCCFVSKDAELAARLRPPIVDLGPQSNSFFAGGSFWFTHR